MKGSPFQELALILLVAIGLWLPFRFLTQKVERPIEEPTVESFATQEAWLDLRFSHAPESATISQNGTVLWQGGGELREDADIQLQLSDVRNVLDLDFRWSENVEQAYVELSLEVGELPSRNLGFWVRGEVQRAWVLEWEEAL
jgi:hypothetical protein